MPHCARVAIVLFFLAAVMLAQQPSNAPVFDVAAVKANKSGPGPAFGLILLPGGRVFAQNVSLRELIRAAYALEDSQLDGGAAWIGSERFDVEARASADATIDVARAMMRTLLAERFRLATHTETRQLPAYEL